LRAIDCRFEAGYGRNSGDGRFFDWRGNLLLARFDRCLFARIALGLQGPSQGAVLFSECTFDQMRDPQPIDSGSSGAMFTNCSISYGDRTQRPAPATELDRYFPGWREQASR